MQGVIREMLKAVPAPIQIAWNAVLLRRKLVEFGFPHRCCRARKVQTAPHVSEAHCIADKKLRHPGRLHHTDSSDDPLDFKVQPGV